LSRRDGTAVARWVSERVAAVCPPGLGHWDPAWNLVEAPSNAFLDALKDWERTGSDADKRRAQETGASVIAAWRAAASEWERAGRPRKQEVAA